MLVNLLSALVALLLIGAFVGAAGVWARRQFGATAVLALWIGTAIVVAALGTVRGASVQRAFSYQPARQHPLWMFGLFAAFFVVTLSVPAVAVSRGTAGSIGRGARRGALLVVPGFVLALLFLIALDLGGVPFLPPR